MLRLAQPVAPRKGVLSSWLTRAATAFSPRGVEALGVRPSEFAPSQWLVGH